MRSKAKIKTRVVKLYLLETEHQRIARHLIEQQAAMLAYAREQYAVQFPDFDILHNIQSSEAHFPFTLSLVVEAAVNTMTRDLYNLSLETMEALSEAYQKLPKSYVSKNRAQSQSYVRVNETSVALNPQMLDQMTEIAKYFKARDVYVPFMMKKDRAAPKVCATIAAMYTANFVLAE